MLTFTNKTQENENRLKEIIDKYEKLLEQSHVRIHGYMMLSGKNIIAEKYYAPYDKTTLHRMYSITKSFVSIAIGMLIKEGKISLQDKICTFFPEYIEEQTHPWCLEMTIEDMLTMRTCYASTTFKRYPSKDWNESFFKVTPDHVAGTVFAYDTSAAHTLAALVEKITGQKLLDYMRTQALDEIGFSKEAYIIPDEVGVSQGGSGLMSTMEDIARVAYLCNHMGVIDGKELISQEYMRQATTKQVSTALQPTIDEQCGYGYMFWMPREEGFVLYGMGGQLAVCFPEYDFCYITMADTIGNPAGLQILYDCFYHTVYPYLQEVAAKKKNIQKSIDDKSKQQDVQHQADEKLEQQNNNSIDELYSLTTEQDSDKIYMCYENAMQMKWIKLDQNKHILSFENNENKYTFAYGENEWKQQLFPNTSYQCECKGSWQGEHFIFECYTVDEEQGHFCMEFAWRKECNKLHGRMTMRAISTSEPFLNKFKGYVSAV